MKKILNLALALTMVITIFSGVTVSANDLFDGGDGTINDPYIITTADQLYEVRYNLDKHFIQMKDIDLTTATSKGGEYYDGGNGWLPIGDYSNSFSGSYNGNGYSIKGMNINRTSTSSLYVGLFYSITGCVKNLTIENCNITAKASDTYGSVYCGGLSAIMKDDAQIINCAVTGSITTSSTYTSLVGGIIGSTQGGTIDKIKIIKDCSTDLTLNVTAKASDRYGTISTGGMIGSGDIMKIVNCSVAGNISVSPSKTNYVGGILGKIEYDAIDMEWCSNKADIQVTYGTNASDTSSYYVGGLIGRISFAVSNPTGDTICIKNCYNSANVSSKICYSTSVNMVGGLIGYTSNTKDYSTGLYEYDCNIINCYNIGKVVGDGSSSMNDIGGIVGENDGFTIKNCYNSADVSAKTSKNGASTPNVGAISGYTTTDVLNTYWNVSSAQIINGSVVADNKKIGVGPSSRTDTAISMSPAKMKAKSFVDNLNSYIPNQQYWEKDNENINNGYPILVKPEDLDTLTYMVSGSVKAFGDTTRYVAIELLNNGEVVDSKNITGNSGAHSFEGVASGAYKMRVSKSKHAPREYEITVGETDVTQNVEIWLYGDLTKDGFVNNADTIQINRRNANLSSVFSQVTDSDYRFKVANVTAVAGTDTIINNADVIQINRMNANLSSVFDRIA